MLNFKTITLDDRDVIEQYIKASDFKSCDYSFVNNFIWSKPNNIEFAIVEGFYCLKSVFKNEALYTFPAGNGNLQSVINALLSDAKDRNMVFGLRGILQDRVLEIERLFPGMFDFTSNRDEFDYIYSVASLTSLSGKKYQSKRNHIARFKDNPNWSYEDITKENIDECFKMNNEWCKKYVCYDDINLKHELCAVKTAFAHFFDLGLTGGLIRQDGKVVAFTIGEPLSSDTYVVHIEKAFSEIQGAYPMINREFLAHNCQAFQYVNREEDMGDEGLRKTKLSYHPEILLEKFTATMKKG